MVLNRLDPTYTRKRVVVPLSKKLLLYAIPRDIKFRLHGSNVQMFGSFGSIVLNNRIFIKHNCVVICYHDLGVHLSKSKIIMLKVLI